MNEGYFPEDGHRVRLTGEGVVEAVFSEGPYTSVRINGAWITVPAGTKVERLSDPEPTWQPGDVVKDAEGQVYRCVFATRSRAWEWETFLGSNVDYSTPRRPLSGPAVFPEVGR